MNSPQGLAEARRDKSRYVALKIFIYERLCEDMFDSFIEFEKIFDKHGDFKYAIELINQFKIKEILGAKVIQPKFVPKIDNIKIKEDFFTCIVNDIEQPGEFLRKKLPQANNKLIIFVETFKELISKNLKTNLILKNILIKYCINVIYNLYIYVLR